MGGWGWSWGGGVVMKVSFLRSLVSRGGTMIGSWTFSPFSPTMKTGFFGSGEGWGFI